MLSGAKRWANISSYYFYVLNFYLDSVNIFWYSGLLFKTNEPDN